MQNEDTNRAIGARVERLRLKYGYSRETLAEHLGITWQHLANIEKGRRGLSNELMLLLRQVFSVPVDYILFGAEGENDLSDLTAVLSGIDPRLYPFVEESVLSFVKAIRKDREVRDE